MKVAMLIEVDQIDIKERQRKDFGDIEGLAKSIDSYGQLQAILVSKEKDGTYTLVDGRRRLEAFFKLGKKKIEATTQKELTEIELKEREYEADVRRKDRTWQEKCTSIVQLHKLKKRSDPDWTQRKLSEALGMSVGHISEAINLADELEKKPKDEELWNAESFSAAFKIIVTREEQKVRAEMEKRRTRNKEIDAAIPSTGSQYESAKDDGFVPEDSSAKNEIEAVGKELTLTDRAMLFNSAYPTQPPIVMHGDDFAFGYWFVGGGNVSDFYGSYQTGYLERVNSMFPDVKGRENFVHLFSGSLPPSDDYTRVGIDPTGQYKSDLEIDAHQLSSYLKFRPKLIMADPPYSVEDSEHYQNSMVDRAKVIEEAGAVLAPGGYIVWQDQALPVFKNKTVNLVGVISYIRSTGNRFRCVCLFKKAE
jgi:ParB/RepB/Spo0J family partition protein